MSEKDEEIQSFVKEVFGEPPEFIGKMVGMTIDRSLSHESLYYLLWWFVNDTEISRKRHMEHLDFLSKL